MNTAIGATYTETFDADSGGWWGWISNSGGPRPLEWQPGQVTSRSPWWIDYNHAPPGAGYLHMLFCTFTRGPIAEHYREVGGPNRFITAGLGRDFTHAALTFRLRGELRQRDAKLVLLVQSTIGDTTSAWVCTGRPLHVSPQWSEQTVNCEPDESQWTCLGGRHDRSDFYGRLPLRQVLADVNCDIMLVLFPLRIAPMGPIGGDPHHLRPEKDYPVWRSELPEGYVTLDTVSITLATKESA